MTKPQKMLVRIKLWNVFTLPGRGGLRLVSENISKFVIMHRACPCEMPNGWSWTVLRLK